MAEAAIGKTGGQLGLGLGLGSVRRGAMREKRKSEKAIFEAKDLVILNLGLLQCPDSREGLYGNRRRL